ncbi:MAG: peptidoglycan-binding protein [Chthoniobacteraceae bacterium]
MMKPDRNAPALIQTRPVSPARDARNRRFLRSLAFTASLACLLPSSLFAKDHDQEDDKHGKKEGKGAPQHPGKGASHQANVPAQGTRPGAPQGGRAAAVQPARGATAQGNKGRHESSRVTNFVQELAPPSRSHGKNAFRNGNAGGGAPQPAAVQNVRGGPQNRQMPNQAQYAAPAGNRENRYGGQWLPGDLHADWGNSGEHYWNHRHYRWYDGGWLIVAPDYDRGYVTRNSVARNVQRRLAVQGYYNGPIDGDIGPGSSRAIMNYQDDNGLRATGRIDERLLVSLGLE